MSNTEKAKELEDQDYSNCNGCNIQMTEKQIAHTTEDGFEYCSDCYSAIKSDDESSGRYRSIGQSVKVIVGEASLNATVLNVVEDDPYPYYVLFEDGCEGWVLKEDLI